MKENSYSPQTTPPNSCSGQARTDGQVNLAVAGVWFCRGALSREQHWNADALTIRSCTTSCLHCQRLEESWQGWDEPRKRWYRYRGHRSPTSSNGTYWFLMTRGCWCASWKAKTERNDGCSWWYPRDRRWQNTAPPIQLLFSRIFGL